MYEQRRNRKPYKRREEWPRRNVKQFWYRRELTEENEEFMKQLAENEYKAKISPLKDSPWERNTYTAELVWLLIFFVTNFTIDTD